MKMALHTRAKSRRAPSLEKVTVSKSGLTVLVTKASGRMENRAEEESSTMLMGIFMKVGRHFYLANLLK